MNKADIKLVIFIIGLILLILGVMYFNKKEPKIANVYYENKIVLTVDLTFKDKQEFYVEGYNGNVHIISENGKIKVDTENSPLNLCSKQGYISSSYETIVCLPNKIIIKIEDALDIDTIVR